MVQVTPSTPLLTSHLSPPPFPAWGGFHPCGSAGGVEGGKGGGEGRSAGGAHIALPLPPTSCPLHIWDRNNLAPHAAPLHGWDRNNLAPHAPSSVLYASLSPPPAWLILVVILGRFRLSPMVAGNGPNTSIHTSQSLTISHTHFRFKDDLKGAGARDF